ncbi:cadherin repeat domain-containing protein [uncultured Psychrosphaera sp.]|uniref:cadherin repeat domain-containing protein n=1 Tax=uncultured Psychrosphaera sp. TaxID=1403522 RepID=UPI00262C9299|nr:cadherin repeat domain-containing protein [uncultured Psychrosphaera sp.]
MYTVTSDDSAADSDLFTIDASSGVVTLSDNADFETQSSYSLRLLLPLSNIHNPVN